MVNNIKRTGFWKGKKLSPEHRLKLSLSHKGQTPWISGKHHTEETKKKLSEIKKGKPSPRKGVKSSPESIEKMRKSRIGKPMHPKTRAALLKSNTGRTIPESLKRKMAEARSKCMVKFRKNSMPERLIQKELRDEGIEFETHKAIFGHPDIFIQPNFCVFVDGIYWHSLPKMIKRDKEVNGRLLSEGYKILRIPVTVSSNKFDYFLASNKIKEFIT